jgi:hypothetical protein
MQKKFLLLCVMISCFMSYSNNFDENVNDDLLQSREELLERKRLQKEGLEVTDKLLQETEIALYDREVFDIGRRALMRQLCGDAKALENEFIKLRIQNEREEHDKNKKQWNGELGWNGTQPTSECDTETAKKKHAVLRSEKDGIIVKYQEIFSRHNNAYSSNVEPLLIKELERKNYLVESQYVRGFQLCGSNPMCLAREGISWEKVSESNFFNEFCSSSYGVAYQKVNQQKIPLTKEEVIEIAKASAKTKLLVELLNNAKEKANNNVRDLLNPKQEEETEKRASIFDNEDPKEDQNNQGALSE